jgi:hypothetical protein
LSWAQKKTGARLGTRSNVPSRDYFFGAFFSCFFFIAFFSFFWLLLPLPMTHSLRR